MEDRKCLCGILRHGQNGARYPTIPLCRDSGMAKQFEKEYEVPVSSKPQIWELLAEEQCKLESCRESWDPSSRKTKSQVLRSRARVTQLSWAWGKSKSVTKSPQGAYSFFGDGRIPTSSFLEPSDRGTLLTHLVWGIRALPWHEQGSSGQVIIHDRDYCITWSGSLAQESKGQICLVLPRA